MIAKNPITLRTPFMVKEFDSLDFIVRTIFRYRIISVR